MRHQVIALLVLGVVVVGLLSRSAAMDLANGNWGGAVGDLLVGPLIVFYLVQAIVYVGVRLLRGKAKVRGFTTSRTNYVALVVTVFSVIGLAVDAYGGPP